MVLATLVVTFVIKIGHPTEPPSGQPRAVLYRGHTQFARRRHSGAASQDGSICT